MELDSKSYRNGLKIARDARVFAPTPNASELFGVIWEAAAMPVPCRTRYCVTGKCQQVRKCVQSGNILGPFAVMNR
jgi:hypothetical protein